MKTSNQKARQRRKARVFIVSAYECDKRYGGSEEGGWYFDTREPVSHPGNRGFKTREAANAYCRSFDSSLMDENRAERRHSPSSVACQGDWLEAWVSKGKPESYPSSRPYYE